MATEHSGSGEPGRSLELLWQGKEPAARGPKPGLTLDEIVDTAIALADRDGISALSMRRVATELDVGTMTLYRYVPGKAELLDLMLDRVAGAADDIEWDPGDTWRDTMKRVAKGTWGVYLEHPWLVQVNQSRPILGPNALAGMEFALRGLSEVGLRSRDKVAIISAIDHLVTGAARTYVLQHQVTAETGITEDDFWAAQAPILEKVLATGEYPELANLDEDAFSIEPDEVLDIGLDAMLDGFENLITARNRPDTT